MKTKQIIIKSDGKGFQIKVKGLSDIEVLGLLTAFKNSVELQVLGNFIQPTG